MKKLPVILFCAFTLGLLSGCATTNSSGSTNTSNSVSTLDQSDYQTMIRNQAAREDAAQADAIRSAGARGGGGGRR